MVLENSL